VDDGSPGDAAPANGWIAAFRREGWAIAEELGYAPLTPDMDFVAFLRTLSRFGFFTFGPVTIDVRVVEDLLYRTAVRGTGGTTHPPVSEEYVDFSNQLWELVRSGGRKRIDELHYLLAFMKWGRGLPGRVFGELGIRVEDVERYARELSSGKSAEPAAERLYSTEEAAAYYGVHIQTVRGWIRSGKLPAVRLAGLKSIRIKESDLRAVLEPIAPGEMGDADQGAPS
jgi:excisionase family DNA binding protein